MSYTFAYQGPTENVARAVSTNVQISTKAAIMVAQFVKHKSVSRALRDLQEVVDKQTAVPYTRFTNGAGHKTKIGPGKYPLKTAKAFIALIKSAQANAQDKGLGEELVIVSCLAQRAAKSMRYGRMRGRQSKSTHIEIIVGEQQNGN